MNRNCATNELEANEDVARSL